MRASELDAAKERLRIPELWHLLGCPGEPGKSCRAPYREDRKPSFSIYADGMRFYDFATGEGGDAIDFLGKVVGVTNGEAIRQFLERASGIPVESVRRFQNDEERKERPKPNLTGFRRGWPHELDQLAATRRISRKAVEAAHDTGLLRFAQVCGYNSWIIKDESGLCAEARRLNAEPYTALDRLPERKAHTIRNSRKNWPVGILPNVEYRGLIDTIALVEGGPDLLSVIHFALRQRRVGILSVAILGRCVCRHGLHPDSLEHFRGMRVRLYPHDDQDGGAYQTAEIITGQLERLGCEVDYFHFTGLRKRSGAKIKDLNDCTEIAAEQLGKLEGLFP
jgi:CHC2 zinc finger